MAQTRRICDLVGIAPDAPTFAPFARYQDGSRLKAGMTPTLAGVCTYKLPLGSEGSVADC